MSRGIAKTAKPPATSQPAQPWARFVQAREHDPSGDDWQKFANLRLLLRYQMTSLPALDGH